MIGATVSVLGVFLRAVPLLFLFIVGRIHALSRSLAAKVRAKIDQVDIAALANCHPSDIFKQMWEQGL